MKAHLFTFLFISFIFLSCKGQNESKYKSVPPVAFANELKNSTNAVLIDVRTPEEYASQHLDNAININWNESSFDSKVNQYDKSKPVFVYCMSGGRSKKAAEKLETLGFKTIYEMQGGILKWNAEGLAAPSKTSIGMSRDEYEKLLKYDKKVLIDFYAEWCGPCKKMSPYLKKMETSLADKVTIIKLDADKNKSLVKELKIEILPTLFIYKNGVLLWKHEGYISESDLIQQLQ
jgi:thioredoxin